MGMAWQVCPQLASKRNTGPGSGLGTHPHLSPQHPRIRGFVQEEPSSAVLKLSLHLQADTDGSHQRQECGF